MEAQVTVPFKIVTPDKCVYETETCYVKIPGHDGELGILPNHSPLLTVVDIGEVLVRLPNNSIDRFFVHQGILQVLSEKVVLLTHQIEKAEEIDFDRAKQAKERALERIQKKTKELDIERARRALERAEVRLHIYNMHHS